MAFIHGIIPRFYETTASDTHKAILPRYTEMLDAFKKKKK